MCNMSEETSYTTDDTISHLGGNERVASVENGPKIQFECVRLVFGFVLSVWNHCLLTALWKLT